MQPTHTLEPQLAAARMPEEPSSTGTPENREYGDHTRAHMHLEAEAQSEQSLQSQGGAPAQVKDFEHPIPLRRRRYMVGTFSLMAALLFADQNLLAPHLTQAANDFGFDDTEKDQYLGGYIMAAFFAVGAPAAMLVGYLGDKYNRVYLLFVVVIVGSTPCLATYWVDTFWQLLLLRTLTGISVGGCLPLVYSLLGDLFPINQRSAISAFILIATGAGLAAGQALSSITGGSNWRIPFVIVAVPNLVVAIVMVATTKEPPRGAFEEALRGAYADGDEYKETISWAKVRQLLKVPSNWLIFIQGLPGSLPWGMMLTFFNDYLSQDKGFSINIATSIVLVFGIGGAAGVIGGGAAGQWIYNRRKEMLAIFMGACVLLGIPPMIYLVNAPLHEINLGGTIIMSLLGGALASVAGPNLRAILMNVNEPETRGVAFALQTTTDDLGKGLGPFIVAWFIKYLGRRNAFNVAVSGWVPCGFLLMSLVFYVRKDEEAMQARLQAKVGGRSMQDLNNQAARSGGASTGFVLVDGDAREVELMGQNSMGAHAGRPGALPGSTSALDKDGGKKGGVDDGKNVIVRVVPASPIINGNVDDGLATQGRLQASYNGGIHNNNNASCSVSSEDDAADGLLLPEGQSSSDFALTGSSRSHHRKQKRRFGMQAAGTGSGKGGFTDPTLHVRLLDMQAASDGQEHSAGSGVLVLGNQLSNSHVMAAHTDQVYVDGSNGRQVHPGATPMSSPAVITSVHASRSAVAEHDNNTSSGTVIQASPNQHAVKSPPVDEHHAPLHQDPMGSTPRLATRMVALPGSIHSSSSSGLSSYSRQ